MSPDMPPQPACQKLRLSIPSCALHLPSSNPTWGHLLMLKVGLGTYPTNHSGQNIQESADMGTLVCFGDLSKHI